jgi:hypothetical protein
LLGGQMRGRLLNPYTTHTPTNCVTITECAFSLKPTTCPFTIVITISRILQHL